MKLPAGRFDDYPNYERTGDEKNVAYCEHLMTCPAQPKSVVTAGELFTEPDGRRGQAKQGQGHGEGKFMYKCVSSMGPSQLDGTWKR